MIALDIGFFDLLGQNQVNHFQTFSWAIDNGIRQLATQVVIIQSIPSQYPPELLRSVLSNQENFHSSQWDAIEPVGVHKNVC